MDPELERYILWLFQRTYLTPTRFDLNPCHDEYLDLNSGPIASCEDVGGSEIDPDTLMGLYQL